MAGPGNTQLTCDCGSTFFYKTGAEQYLAGGYGSAEFRSTSNAPKTVLICLCGKPFPAKPTMGLSQSTVAGIAESAFQKSIASAQKRRDELSLKHMAEISASPSEVRQLQTQIDQLQAGFNAITAPAAPQPKNAPKTPAKSRKIAEKPIAQPVVA